MVTGDGHSSFSGELGKMCQYRENQRKRKLYRLLIFRNTAGTAVIDARHSILRMNK